MSSSFLLRCLKWQWVTELHLSPPPPRRSWRKENICFFREWSWRMWWDCVLDVSRVASYSTLNFALQIPLLSLNRLAIFHLYLMHVLHPTRALPYIFLYVPLFSLTSLHLSTFSSFHFTFTTSSDIPLLVYSHLSHISSRFSYISFLEVGGRSLKNPQCPAHACRSGVWMFTVYLTTQSKKAHTVEPHYNGHYYNGRRL
jgi:hypothetical protein